MSVVATSFRRTAALAASAAGTALVLALASATSAAADVLVTPSTATQGDYTTLTFVVPNESESTGTVKVRVQFPTRPTLPSVRIKRKAGWTADVVKAKVKGPGDTCECTITPTVTSITWTAGKGAHIRPGEFDEFEVLVGPLPVRKRLTFPTVQSFDDGSVERWTAPASADTQPAHPAPTLTLRTPPTVDSAAAAPGTPSDGETRGGLTRAALSGAARWAGVTAVVLGLVVMAAAGGLALARRRGA
jgi:periplasmic copper chaperone A